MGFYEDEMAIENHFRILENEYLSSEPIEFRYTNKQAEKVKELYKSMKEEFIAEAANILEYAIEEFPEELKDEFTEFVYDEVLW